MNFPQLILIFGTFIIIAIGGFSWLGSRNKDSVCRPLDVARSEVLQVKEASVSAQKKDFNDMLGYVDLKNRIKICYPKDWVRHKTPEGFYIPVYFEKNRLEIHYEVTNRKKGNVRDIKNLEGDIVLRLEDSNKKKGDWGDAKDDLEEFITLKLEDSKDHPNFKIISKEKSILSKLPAYRVVSEDVPYKIVTYYALDDSHFYTVRYIAYDKEQFDEMLTVAERAIRSFEIY